VKPPRDQPGESGQGEAEGTRRKAIAERKRKGARETSRAPFVFFTDPEAAGLRDGDCRAGLDLLVAVLVVPVRRPYFEQPTQSLAADPPGAVKLTERGAPPAGLRLAGVRE